LPEILQEVKKIEQEAKAIKKEILQICWYMRGLSYTEAMHMAFDEREIVNEIVKDHLETTKKSGLPFF
jgi:hypothetical protein